MSVMRLESRRPWSLLLAGASIWACLSGTAAAQSRPAPLEALEAAMPAAVADFTGPRVSEVERRAPDVERWVAELAEYRGLVRPEQFVQRVDALVSLNNRVEVLLDQTLALRGSFINTGEEPGQRDLLRNYLGATSALIDLSGRLRYLLYDGIYEAAYQVAPRPETRERLIDVLTAYRSSVGAAVMAEALFDPPADSANRARPASRVVKQKLLELIARTGEWTVLPTVAEFARSPQASPELVLAAASAIRRIGLPQDSRPGQDPDLPAPTITARELSELVGRVDASRLDPSWNRLRTDLLAWLDVRVREGVTGESYRLGNCEVRPGDWLLMRNPSPYNLFTDLAPGLFTHVGVITAEIGSDGIRRMVLVDLPERGKQIQTTPIDIFVQRSLHYVVLRHQDPQVCRAMAKTAEAIIGNPSMFDLNFRTARVESLRGKPLAGQTIHTYCAGLLLLCAQETTATRSDFFPIPEYPAGGKTVENLARLGLTFGEDFISPTGALFSPQLVIVGRRESMYDPSRAIEEAVYNEFARRLADRTLYLSPNLFQSLRLKIAEAGRTNPLVSRALAGAAGVSEELDLVAAAKAAALVEALDEVAQRSSGGFRGARAALTAGPSEQLANQEFDQEEIAAIAAYRQRHASLHRLWAAGQLSPRQLRIALVQYYIDKGNRDLDERFFQEGQ